MPGSRYRIRARSTLVTATALAPLWLVRGSTTQRTRLLKVKVFPITAPTTRGCIGVMRSTAQATTLTSVTGQQLEPGDVATASLIATGWSGAPTVGALGTVIDEFAFAPAVGGGIIEPYDLLGPLILPLGNVATGDLVFVNLEGTAPGTYDIVVEVEE